MSPLEYSLATFGVSLIAGMLGSTFGLGGGILVIPFLTLGLGVDLHHAAGASIVSIIATSSGGAVACLKGRLTNLRVAMFLELGTAAGAVVGALAAGMLSPRPLFILFSGVLTFSALSMLRKGVAPGQALPPDPLADRLDLHGTYKEQPDQPTLPYRVTGSLKGLSLMGLAGVISGLLGVGSGTIKVLAMDLAMGLPFKVSSATSSFMIGVTAAASAGVYFFRGDILPMVAAPVALGVILGTNLGVRILRRGRTPLLRNAFVILLLLVAVQMLWKGVSA